MSAADHVVGSSPARVLFIQDGARRRYAVPIALHRAALLQRMCCDWYSTPGSWQSVLAGIMPRVGQRMAGRYTPELPAHLIASNSWLALHRRNTAGYARASQGMTSWVRRRGFLRDANVLMGFVRNLDPALAELAQQQGLITVADQIIAPAAMERAELERQQQRFPRYELATHTDDLGACQSWEQRTWQALDVITAMSSHVRGGLLAQGVPADRIALLEYPFDAAGFDVVDRAGRSDITVGFVGAINLRKGAPYFLQVAKRLASPTLRFVMVGASQLSPTVMADHRDGVDFTGPLPRAQVVEQLHRFDMLLFPSTCEGSAGAVMEAMATGLPVITSPNAGSVARDGVDGFVIPYDDIDALAERVNQLACDAALRLHMGRSAAERARQFTLDRYQFKLANLLRDRVVARAGGRP